MHRASFSIAVVALLLHACSGNHSPQDAGTFDATSERSWDTECGPNLRPHKSACVPKLDDCDGNQVPIPGGGCKRIGVEACEIDGSAGLKAPPDWQCKRVGVEQCEANGGPGIKGPPDWTCKPIGPPRDCLLGWALTSDGVCEPILPKTECPVGTVEVIGSEVCLPIGDCGSGTYGNIKISSRTVFVNQLFIGPLSNGSQKYPFLTISEALQAAGPGANIAVAAGVYAEQLDIDSRIVVEGRCAQMVTIDGQQQVAVRIAADGTELRGVTVKGDKDGIVIDGASATIEQVAVVGCGGVGVEARNKASATLRNVLIDRAGVSTFGARAIGSTLSMSQCVVRDKPSSVIGETNAAIAATGGNSGPATLTLTDCVVANNRDAGVVVRDAAATILRSAVTGTQQVAQSFFGPGILTASDGTATLALRDCLVANNRNAGIQLDGSTATIERTIVRDTLPQISGDMAGNGVGVSVTGLGTAPSQVTATDCLLARNHGSGLAVWGGSGRVQRTIVRDHKPGPEKRFGVGLIAVPAERWPSSLIVRDALVTSNLSSGIRVIASTVTVERSIIRDTNSSPTGNVGAGVIADYHRGGATLTVRDSLVTANTMAGVLVINSSANLERTIVQNTRPQKPDDILGAGILASPAAPALPRSTVRINESVLSGNRVAGIMGTDSTIHVAKTLVTDTRPGFGQPISAQERWKFAIAVAAEQYSKPTALTVLDSTLEGNYDQNIGSSGATLTVERTVVRDARRDASSNQASGQPSVGIFAQPTPDASKSGELTIVDTRVEDVGYVGVGAFHTTATVERTVVRNTRAQTDFFGIEMGVGIYAGVLPDVLADEIPAEWKNFRHPLTLRDTIVIGSHRSGLVLWATEATVQRSIIELTRGLRGRWGDGISAASKKDRGELDLTLEDSIVTASDRAGLLFSGGKGNVRRSVFSGGTFSIVLSNGADPTIADNNVFEDNTEDALSFHQSLEPSPIPVPSIPQL